ncbi:MAG: TMEM143 family protein [Gemmatales bacterium]|nr:TMEM143 family protein [Gemmatales bacterium]MDW8385873.1 DUF3754 domain-containing protein [Gemmatales bacterium]
MSDHTDPEHFIPIRKCDLLDHLCHDLGSETPEAQQLRQVARILEAIIHYEYHVKLEDLKTAYAPFDPDTETHPLVPLNRQEKLQHLEDLIQRFIWLLERANFTRLSRQDIEKAIKEGTQWGLRIDVDFSMFDKLEIFARGATTIKRKRQRGIWPWTRVEEYEVPVYRRLVIILRMKPHPHLPSYVDTDNVFIKIFKDIPRMDLEMLLPGSRVRMTRLDQGKVAVPVATGLTVTGYKVFSLGAAGLKLLTSLSSISSLVLLATLAGGTIGYGWRTFSGYQNTRRRYQLVLTENLYFHTLDNNCGALFRLLDEAEEQEFREAMLAYYLLWRQAPPEGWDMETLDRRVEEFLATTAGIKVDFEIDDALEKAIRFGMVERLADGRMRAHKPSEVLRKLDHLWDNYFNYNTPGICGNGKPPPEPPPDDYVI